MRISQAEFRLRLERTSRALVEHELDALVAYASHVQYGAVRYLTGYEPWLAPEEWAFAVLTPGHQTEIALVSNSPWDFWDFNRDDNTWVPKVIVSSRWVESIAALLPSNVRRVGLAGWSGFPAPVYLGLSERFPRSRFDDATSLVRDLRAVKSSAEIEILRQVGQLADEGGRAFIQAVAPNVSEREIAARVDSALMRGGAEQQGYFTLLASGTKTVASCSLPTPRRVREGEIVQLDCAPMLDGYKGDFSRITVVGRGAPRALHLVETIADTFERCRDLLKPGITCAAIARAGFETIVAHGYGRENLFSSANYPGVIFMGHGIGLENPDPPGMLSSTNETVLEEDMVINLEPIILDPEVGGGRIEAAFRVTAQGPEPLSHCEIRPWRN